jgi:hypothetical protein
MASHRTLPTWEDIRDHFEVSRATAFRWLNEYADARGIVRARTARTYDRTPGLRRKQRTTRPCELSWPAISRPMPSVSDKPSVELPSKVQRAFVILTKDMRAYHAVLDAAESGRTLARHEAR